MVFGRLIYLYSLNQVMIKKVAWFSFFALLAVSCLDDPDCYNLSLNVIGISFRKIAGDKADTVYLNRVTMEGTDSIFVEEAFATGVLIPLNYLTNQSNIIFTRPAIDGSFTNTLVLAYNAKAQFVSEDCGERYLVSDLAVVSSDFDSTRLVSRTPTKNPSTNIVIYRCPITNYVRFSFKQWDTDEENIFGSELTTQLNGITEDYSTNVYWANQSVSTARVPLNSGLNATTFNLDFVDYGSTSITLNYKSVLQTLYPVCGEQKFFSDLVIADYQSEFDKVEVVKDSIQDPPVTNVVLYKCPTTNRIKIVFRQNANSSASAPVNIVKITADYTSEEFYVNQSNVSTVELPLNEGANNTTYTFTLDKGVRTLQLSYNRNFNQYHEVCDQTEMTSIAITATDFSASQVLDPTSKFPADNNIAVIY